MRRAPRRRSLRRQLEAFSVSWQELEASVADAHAVATGALRVLAERNEPAPALAAAVAAAAEAVRSVDPDDARNAAEAARAAAERADQAPSLGADVIRHGVIGVAEHALRAAAAREEGRRLAPSRIQREGLRVTRPRR